MHITIIANNFQEEYIYNLINNLSLQVDRLDFIGSPLYNKEKINSNIKFYKFRHYYHDKESQVKKTYGIIDYYLKLIKYLFTSPSKIIHVQWLKFNFIEGVLIAILIKLLGKKVIYTAHNPLPHNTDGLYFRTLFKLIYKIQSQLIVHTSYIKDEISRQFGTNPQKIHVVPHGVYMKKMNPSVTKSTARDSLGLSKNAKVLLFFGYINEYKGFDVLVKAINLLDETAPLEIMVAGKVQNGYEKAFESILKEKKSGKYVLLTEYVSEEKLELCFKAADVTVLPYKEASQSGVLFMSYSFGVPVIAPYLGGFPSDIIPNKTGYLFEPKNPVSLSKTIMLFLEEWAAPSPERGNFITNFAYNNYSWTSSCKKLVDIYSHDKQNSRKSILK